MINDFKFLGVAHEMQNNGNFIMKQSWIINSNATMEKLAYEDAVAWAGKVGDFFRYPNFDNQSYSFDNVVKVNKIEITTNEDNFTFGVNFIHETSLVDRLTFDDDAASGSMQAINNGVFDSETPEKLLLKSKKFTTSIDLNGDQERVFLYKYYGTAQSLLLPKVGGFIKVDGLDYIIGSVMQDKIAEFEFDLKIVGKKYVVPARLISEKIDHDNYEKNLKYFVEKPALEEFLAHLTVGEPSALGGENFYLNTVDQENNGVLGSVVSLNFREIKTRILSQSREERLASFINGDVPNPEIIYKSTWQVAAPEIGEFQNITGTPATNWADYDTVVTKVIPKKISELEYLVELEAQSCQNQSLYKNYSMEFYHSLSSRVDYSLRLIEFKLNPRQCGYILRDNGSYWKVDGWASIVECPFTTNTALPINMINAICKLIEISETKYLRGDISNNVKTIINWRNNRILNGEIANFSGSFLKADTYTSEVFDNFGRKWTKWTCVYHLAPNSYSWNFGYWQNKS